MNKREFVMGGCAALAGGAACAGATTTQASTGQRQGLRSRRLPDLATDVRSQAWRAYLGHQFEAVVSGTAVPLTLREISMHGVDEANLEQFTLCFGSSSQAAMPLPAGTHVLAHPTGQRMAVYLDPATSQGAVPRAYRAHFSLIV